MIFDAKQYGDEPRFLQTLSIYSLHKTSTENLLSKPIKNPKVQTKPHKTFPNPPKSMLTIANAIRQQAASDGINTSDTIIIQTSAINTLRSRVIPMIAN